MTMKMLRAGGLEIVTDGIREADDSNPEGYFELEQVLTLDKGADHSWLVAARGKAIKIISALLPHLPESNNYKVIFMHRDLQEVIASQNTMLARRGESLDPASRKDDRMRELFEAHLAQVRNLLGRRACFDTLHVNYRDVVSHPRTEAERIASFLGRHLDVVRMAEAVNPSLHRNRREHLAG
jgi:hypothetical protein